MIIAGRIHNYYYTCTFFYFQVELNHVYKPDIFNTTTGPVFTPNYSFLYCRETEKDLTKIEIHRALPVHRLPADLLPCAAAQPSSFSPLQIP